DHVRDHVAHSHHHVAVIHYLHLLTQPPVTWNHVRPNSLVDKWRRWNRQFDQLVQGVNLSPDAAAVRDINHWKSRFVQNVSGHHHVRPAEKYETVGIRVGLRL